MTTATATKTTTSIKMPSQFKVVMLNDKETPDSFIASVLLKVFDHGDSASAQIIQRLRSENRATVMITTHEIAKQKVEDAHKLIAHFGHGIQCRVEPA